MLKLTLFFTVSFFLLNCIACSKTRPEGLGVKDGKLLPCPASPNCVSSQSKDARHRIEPLSYPSSSQEAKECLLTILNSMKRTTIPVANDSYIHAECFSLLFRFIDDLEFSIDDETKTIQVRSAARLGYYDFGVNRRRVETVKKKFLKRQTAQGK